MLKLISCPGTKIDPTKRVSLQQPVDPLVSTSGMGLVAVLGAQITALSALMPAPPQAEAGTVAPIPVISASATVSPVGLNPYDVM